MNHATWRGDSHTNEKNVALKQCNFLLPRLWQNLGTPDPTVEGEGGRGKKNKAKKKKKTIKRAPNYSHRGHRGTGAVAVLVGTALGSTGPAGDAALPQGA